MPSLGPYTQPWKPMPLVELWMETSFLQTLVGLAFSNSYLIPHPWEPHPWELTPIHTDLGTPTWEHTDTPLPPYLWPHLYLPLTSDRSLPSPDERSFPLTPSL